MKNLLTTLVIASVVLITGCKKDDFVEVPGMCPVVATTNPLNLAVNVPLNQIITVTFNEEMDASTITSTSFIVFGSVVPGTITYSGKTATFTPTSPLIANHTYTGKITTAIKDLKGNAIQTNYVWTFSTGATIAPMVASTDPLNNEIGVVLNKVITATFNIPMDPATLVSPATTFTVKQGATVVPGTVTYSGTIASFTPTSVLTANTVYTATITTAAEDLTSKSLAGNYVWSFTTGSLIAPVVTATDPLNNAIGVPLNKILTATFDVPMNAATLASPATTFTLKHGATVVTGTVTYLGNTATFTPSANLLSGTVYTATISTGAKNVAGTGIANPYVWNFTTVVALAPTVTASDPLNNATGVALNKIITATFSVPMNAATLASPATTFTLKQGVTNIPGTVTYVGSTASFTPTTNLLSGTVYTATISTGAQNVAGTGLASNYVWTFTTVPPLGPLAPVLNTVARFGIISGVGVSNNAGPSEIHNLDVGIYPGVRTSITGFAAVDGGPGLIFGGAFYAADDIAPPGVPAMLLQAKNDLVTAYNQAMGATIPAPAIAPADLGGQTLAPGIWTSATTMLLQNGDLTLDAQGDANAVWIFQVGTAFTSIGTSPHPSPSGGNVILAGGAQAKNVYWVVGSSATIGDYTSFYGTVLAFSSITMNTGATATGRMLARNAAVTLTSTNIINKP